MLNALLSTYLPSFLLIQDSLSNGVGPNVRAGFPGLNIMSYSFIHVDRSVADLPSVATQYKTLRLEALNQSPEAFSSTWDSESLYTDDIWISRLTDPEKVAFACVYTDGQTSRWVGQVTMRGPLSAEEFALPPESGQTTPESDEKDEKWQMLSLYISIDHRGKGLSAKLCQAAFGFLSDRVKRGPTLTVRLMLKPENSAALRLYERLGFIWTGACTLEEALRANGDADALPAGVLMDKYTARTGMIMAKRFAGEEVIMA